MFYPYIVLGRIRLEIFLFSSTGLAANTELQARDELKHQEAIKQSSESERLDGLRILSACYFEGTVFKELIVPGRYTVDDSFQWSVSYAVNKTDHLLYASYCSSH